MHTLGRLNDAGVVLGNFDATGLLAVEGPGFKVLVDEREALAYMRNVLVELLEDDDLI